MKYEGIQLEIFRFENEDVITASDDVTAVGGGGSSS